MYFLNQIALLVISFQLVCSQIEIKPSELAIKRGSNITVRCQTNLKRSNLTKNLKWKFCYNYQDKNCQVLPSQQSPTLQLYNINETSLGNYYCELDYIKSNYFKLLFIESNEIVKKAEKTLDL